MGRDDDYRVTLGERIEFWLENYVSTASQNKFYLLLWVTLPFLVIFTIAFAVARDVDWGTSLYIMTQVITTGGFDDGIEDIFPRFVVLVTLLIGINLFAVLIGFINEFVMSTMGALSEGKSKVACSGHTLILGWNETTVRCVCQIAFLRRAYFRQNATCRRRCCPWTRVPPSSPIACGKIVLMCNTKSKDEMDNTLRDGLFERGITGGNTRIGTDVICRIGDPTEPHDLLRVGGHRAVAVLTLLTEGDIEEEEQSNGSIKNGTTLRALLALKLILQRHGEEDVFWEQFRCVLHLESSSSTIDAAIFQSPSGRSLVRPLDLRSVVNSMMFSTAANPALPDIMLELLHFDGCAFRARDASDLRLVGWTVQECALIWEDAVFIGVVDKSTIIHKAKPDFNQGIACDPNRVITKNDRVIFVSATSLPTPRANKHFEQTPVCLSHVSKPGKQPVDTLVCGWRDTWSDGLRLAKRILMVARCSTPGSNIVFLNMKEDFFDILGSAMYPDGRPYVRKNGKHFEINDLRIFHVFGDAGDSDTLRQCMRNPNMSLWEGEKFETVIVLGTMAKPLPKRSQDMRMLSTYVLVHQIHQEVYGDTPLHVIGENQLDSTAALARAVSAKDSVKDMVNSQAMFARGLVQALAFPFSQPAIEQLFVDVPGNPALTLFRAGLGIVPLGTATFGDITRTVLEHVQMAGAVCLGVVVDGEQILAPSPDECFHLQEGDYMIVIERGESVVSKGARLRVSHWSPRDVTPLLRDGAVSSSSSSSDSSGEGSSEDGR
eukprot:TRINITY_DN12158_c0_g1_i2.p1 TRINITY_DN12158_c0_g1~~TRINITY_DN12158_c0_g1_i2.p1  ORF type:complete len:774 (+),score=81.57 TRINITY_DN12158_c0_g1_i2:50-2371(+)